MTQGDLSQAHSSQAPRARPPAVPAWLPYQGCPKVGNPDLLPALSPPDVANLNGTGRAVGAEPVYKQKGSSYWMESGSWGGGGPSLALSWLRTGQRRARQAAKVLLPGRNLGMPNTATATFEGPLRPLSFPAPTCSCSCRMRPCSPVGHQAQSLSRGTGAGRQAGRQADGSNYRPKQDGGNWEGPESRRDTGLGEGRSEKRTLACPTELRVWTGQSCQFPSRIWVLPFP